MTPETRFANRFCKAFEAAGWTTINMESLGDGIPDRLIAKQGKAFLIEAKIGRNTITKHQEVWLKRNYKNNIPYVIVVKDNKFIYFSFLSISEGEIIQHAHLGYTIPGMVDFFEERLLK